MAADGPQDTGRDEPQAGGHAQQQQHAARLRGRNLLLGGALLVLVLLLYAVSFVKTPSAPVAPATGQAAQPAAAQPLSGLRKE